MLWSGAPHSTILRHNYTQEIPPMNNKSITPNLQQPVDRVPTGQLPSALAELSEEALGLGVLPLGSQGGFCNGFIVGPGLCSYDGGDE